MCVSTERGLFCTVYPPTVTSFAPLRKLAFFQLPSANSSLKQIAIATGRDAGRLYSKLQCAEQRHRIESDTHNGYVLTSIRARARSHKHAIACARAVTASLQMLVHAMTCNRLLPIYRDRICDAVRAMSSERLTSLSSFRLMQQTSGPQTCARAQPKPFKAFPSPVKCNVSCIFLQSMDHNTSLPC
jgi:hypothetical protein